MSLQSILKPNNCNIFMANSQQSGEAIIFENLSQPTVGALLTADQIKGGLVISNNTSGGNLTYTLPSVASLYSGSGGTGNVPANYSFTCWFHANEDGSGGMVINSSGGAGNFAIRNNSGGELTIPEGQSAFANFFIYLDGGVPSGDVFYILSA